jgi:acyl-CoA thioester hydrolase
MTSSPNNRLYRHTLRVRYSEVDAQGIVFNANYLNYIDVAIGELFRSKGLNYAAFVRDHAVDFHVIRSVLDFRYGATYDDDLDICLDAEYGGPKIFWKVEFYKQDRLICSGELVYIAIDTASKKVVEIRPDIAALLGIPPIPERGQETRS